jgi:hypothetical protein
MNSQEVPALRMERETGFEAAAARATLRAVDGGRGQLLAARAVAGLLAKRTHQPIRSMILGGERSGTVAKFAPTSATGSRRGWCS